MKQDHQLKIVVPINESIKILAGKFILQILHPFSEEVPWGVAFLPVCNASLMYVNGYITESFHQNATTKYTACYTHTFTNLSLFVVGFV